MNAAIAATSRGEHVLSWSSSVLKRTTLIHRPFCTTQSSTSSNIRGSWRAHSHVSKSSGSGSTIRDATLRPWPITPTCDHVAQIKLSTHCDKSVRNCLSKLFMANPFQGLFQFVAEVAAGFPRKQPIQRQASFLLSRLQIHQIPEVSFRSCFG